jgi:hypothetical protein
VGVRALIGGIAVLAGIRVRYSVRAFGQGLDNNVLLTHHRSNNDMPNHSDFHDMHGLVRFENVLMRLGDRIPERKFGGAKGKKLRVWSVLRSTEDQSSIFVSEQVLIIRLGGFLRLGSFHD